MSDTLLESAVRAAHHALNGEGNTARARAILRDPEKPAAALYTAARRVFGPEFVRWEPETIHLQVDMPAPARDKLLAAMALDVLPAFYWDARVLGNTTLAFNDEAVSPDRMPHVTPEQLAWAVTEAELIFALSDDSGAEAEFDDEAATYVAAMLFDAGFVVCPEELAFAESHLKRLLSPEGLSLRAKVKAARKDPKAESDEDSALGVQMRNLAAVHEYVQRRLEVLRDAVDF